jgi:hypothetical protein
VWGLLDKYSYLRDGIRKYRSENKYKESKDKCFEYLELLKKEEKEYTKDIWFCYFMLAKNCMYLKEKEAILYIYEALKYAQLSKNLSDYMDTMLLKIRVYEELHKEIAFALYEDNRMYLEQLITPFDNNNKSFEKYEILSWLSLIYNNIGYLLSDNAFTYSRSEEELLKAIDIKEELINYKQFEEYKIGNQIKKLDNCYDNLCNLYLKFETIPYIKIYSIINKINNRELKKQLLDKMLTVQNCKHK